jgi:hypothetical protein
VSLRGAWWFLFLCVLPKMWRQNSDQIQGGGGKSRGGCKCNFYYYSINESPKGVSLFGMSKCCHVWNRPSKKYDSHKLLHEIVQNLHNKFLSLLKMCYSTTLKMRHNAHLHIKKRKGNNNIISETLFIQLLIMTKRQHY